ncbi:Gfo/Idh/MocA family protein [Lederbergia wuyishanensis]|nr:Gfo/Idh/MocA family oxidoreductase [Lederbergia wuyishanensis]MCJ8009923.1 Gfo/Idh/MocA family oxidoreductase [Lederbergia wuyishanensis]
MMAMKVGVIGAGSISEFHLKAYMNNPDVELYAICDLNEERAKEKAAKYGIKFVHTNYEEMLQDPELEAVSVCTWNNTHAPISIAALNAGKHVLSEKPLCKTVDEALRVEEAVKKSNKVFQIGYVRRYEPSTNVLKSFIDSGDLGEIYYAKASYIRRLGNPGGWFADKERSGGGPLIDLGVHIIDICWYLMGKPKVKSVSGNVYQKLGNRSNIQNLSFYKAADYDPNVNTVEDMANALVRFENGASIFVDVSFTAHAKKDEISLKLYGDKGGAEVDPNLVIMSEKHDTILNTEPQVDPISADYAVPFQNEINHFIECCKTGNRPISPIEDGVEMMKILCGIYESSEKKSEIHFNTEPQPV